MKRLFIIHICLFLFPLMSQAQVHYVYESNTPHAHILLQPQQGVYLGQMMRNIGLKPDWSNRLWVKETHLANPGIVDEAGEILGHSEKIKVPLAGIKNLKGYNKLERGFQPAEYTPQPEPKLAPVEPAIVESEPPPPAKESELRLEVKPIGFKRHHVEFLIGGGVESLMADNNSGNDTTLTSNMNLMARLLWDIRINPNHKIGILVQGQFKDYQEPPSISLTEDSSALFFAEYNYGYRLFNNFYVHLVGTSKQHNFIFFPNTVIQIETAWTHAAGLMVGSPLFHIGKSQVTFNLLGQMIYEASSESSIDSGMFGRFRLQFEPLTDETGIIVGGEFNYHQQNPQGYSSHQSTEGFAYIGYGF